jgi:hypothetical protein
MRRVLVHLVLATALLFQGLEAPCAPMPTDMTPMATADGVPCTEPPGCPGCPDDDMAACIQGCPLPAAAVVVAPGVHHTSGREALPLSPAVHRVTYLQAPPTPPPIV